MEFTENMDTLLVKHYCLSCNEVVSVDVLNETDECPNCGKCDTRRVHIEAGYDYIVVGLKYLLDKYPKSKYLLNSFHNIKPLWKKDIISYVFNKPGVIVDGKLHQLK